MTAAAAPLVEELIPCPDPWDVARKLAHLPHLLFLDSAERGGDRGRYSYVAADGPATWGYNFRSRPPKPQLFDQLLRDWTGPRVETIPGLPPFQGGLACLFGYDLGRNFESRVPEPASDEFQVPCFALAFYRWVIAFDHAVNRAWVVVSGQGGPDARQTLRRVMSILEQPERPPRPMTWQLPDERPVSREEVGSQHPLPGFPTVTSNFSRDGYLAAVRRAVEYVHAGDVFQVNLSQRLLAPLTEHPLELYGRLRRVSPAPFACYFDLGDFQIASASPERFLHLSADGEVSTRPIKGTRPRGATPAEDAALIRDLTTNPKDRAENVMIVDLLRNDLGRVCEFGSVRVPAVCEVESFRHVHHLVSEVRGKLRPGLTAFDLLRAAFPGGSVTGAPKVRAMEIIAELEPTARGPYCGSVGWVGFDGAMDTNILIRTFTAGRGWVQFPVGGGIVADSDPATVRRNAMILEGLVTTTDANGQAHLAPMGPTVDPSLTTLLLRPFPTSNTYQNLVRHGEGVFHTTDDARLIAYAAVGKLPAVPPTNPATAVAGFVLAGACRAFEFRVRSIDASRERVHIEAEVVQRNSLREFLGFNRAKHAVIEAAILATRFHLLPADEIAAEFKKLRVIVDKTGGAAEFEAMAMLEAEWTVYCLKPQAVRPGLEEPPFQGSNHLRPEGPVPPAQASRPGGDSP